MSLHNLAHHVQSAGRGDDKVLVHMTPGEVKGLQSIAMAHGGSLTINPETGLPEAGFLKSLLPMIAGLGLTALSGGALSPLMAAGIVGGGTAVATGDLKKGLMAGLGAYGGAGLGSGLMAQGAGTAANTATGTVANTPAMNLGNTTVEGMKSNLYGPGQGIFSTTSNASYIPTNPGFSAASTSQFPKVAAFNANANMPSFTPAQINLTDMPKQALVGVNQTLPTAATVNPAEVIAPRSGFGQLAEGAKTSFSSTEGLKGLYKAMPTGSVVASGLTLANAMKPEYEPPEKDEGMIRPYEFEYNPTNVAMEPYSGSAERTYFNPVFTAKTPYKAPGPEYAAQGGLMGFAAGGTMDNPRAVLASAQQELTSKDPVQQMSQMNALGGGTGYPMANVKTPSYNISRATPIPTNMVDPMGDTNVDPYTGAERFASGGMSHLGGYSDGGRLLEGPGDGVSDSIPASIGGRQPARLADGEFVVPARIVSEIGNGSTKAGARKLYAMMDRVQKARRKTVGKNQVARNTKADKLLPA